MNPYYIPGMIRKLTASQVEDIVCRVFEADVEQVRTRTRRQEVVMVRQTVMYALLKIGFKTCEVAGMYDMNHATAVHARKKIKILKEVRDKYYAPKIEQVESIIYPAVKAETRN